MGRWSRATMLPLAIPTICKASVLEEALAQRYAEVRKGKNLRRYTFFALRWEKTSFRSSRGRLFKLSAVAYYTPNGRASQDAHIFNDELKSFFLCAPLRES
jgi:hypothetical protein